MPGNGRPPWNPANRDNILSDTKPLVDPSDLDTDLVDVRTGKEPRAWTPKTSRSNLFGRDDLQMSEDTPLYFHNGQWRKRWFNGDYSDVDQPMQNRAEALFRGQNNGVGTSEYLTRRDRSMEDAQGDETHTDERQRAVDTAWEMHGLEPDFGSAPDYSPQDKTPYVVLTAEMDPAPPGQKPHPNTPFIHPDKVSPGTQRRDAYRHEGAPAGLGTRAASAGFEAVDAARDEEIERARAARRE